MPRAWHVQFRLPPFPLHGQAPVVYHFLLECAGPGTENIGRLFRMALINYEDCGGSRHSGKHDESHGKQNPCQSVQATGKSREGSRSAAHSPRSGRNSIEQDRYLYGTKKSWHCLSEQHPNIPPPSPPALPDPQLPSWTSRRDGLATSIRVSTRLLHLVRQVWKTSSAARDHSHHPKPRNPD